MICSKQSKKRMNWFINKLLPILLLIFFMKQDLCPRHNQYNGPLVYFALLLIPVTIKLESKFKIPP